jgi:hypothetical protein
MATAQRKGHGKKQPAKHAKKITTKAEKKKKEKQPKVAEKKVVAKDTADLKNTTIEIVQSYRPEIRLDIKRESVPLLPPVDSATANVNYTVPSQSLSYGYFALPLRPLALAKDSAERSFANYVKVGGGNLSTLLLDAGIGSIKGKNYSLALRLHHLSQAGKIIDQKTSLSGLRADGSFRTSKNVWNGGVNIFRDVYSLYGFNDVRVVPNPTVIQNLIGADLYADIQRTNEDTKWVYRPSIKASFLLDALYGTEYGASITLPFSYAINERLHFVTGFNGSYVNLNSTLFTQTNNNTGQILLGVEYKNGPIGLKAVIQPTIGKINNWYLLPDISASYSIPKTQLSVSAGWKGALRQNTLSQLLQVNPYLRYNSNTLQQTHADEVYASVKTNIGNHIVIRGKISWKQYDNIPLMINDTGLNNRYFMISYDKVNALSFEGDVRYQMGDFVSVGFGFIYTSFNTTINKRAWHEPGLKLNWDLIVHPLPKLTVTANMAILDQIYAVDIGNKTVKLKSITDLGCGAEYNFMPRLSGFVQVNNILNKSYERWYGYQAYGFNIFGGIRLKF